MYTMVYTNFTYQGKISNYHESTECNYYMLPNLICRSWKHRSICLIWEGHIE